MIKSIQIELKEKTISFQVGAFILDEKGTETTEKIIQISVSDGIKIEILTSERKIHFINVPFYYDIKLEEK